jgi:hypothetical protein
MTSLKQYISGSVISLMNLARNAHETIRGFTQLYNGGECDFGELCGVAGGFLQKMEQDGELKWPLLQNCVAALGDQKQVFTNLFYEHRPYEVWIVSDSWLCFGEPKERKDHVFGTMWPQYQHIWGNFVTDVKFGIQGAGKLPELIAQLKKLCDADPICQGDPALFRGHVCFCTALNDVKKGNKCLGSQALEITAKANEYLQKFPQGTVSICGPGSDKIWGYDKWVPFKSFDITALEWMKQLARSGHPIYSVESVLEAMELIAGDIHFSNAPRNYELAIHMITHLTASTYFLSDLARLATTTGHLAVFHGIPLTPGARGDPELALQHEEERKAIEAS